MRWTRKLVACTLALSLMLVVSGGAEAATTTVSYLFSGSVFETSDYFAATSQGIVLASHNTEVLVWARRLRRQCSARAPSPRTELLLPGSRAVRDRRDH